MRDRRGERSRRLHRYCAAANNTRADDRGQLSLAVVEAVVVTLFILAVAAGFAFVPFAPTAESDALARQATGAASLVGSVPAERLGTFPGVACRSPAEFDDRAARLHEVAAAELPNSAFVSLRTKVGSVGKLPPGAARVRTATAVILRCTATLEI